MRRLEENRDWDGDTPFLPTSGSGGNPSSSGTYSSSKYPVENQIHDVSKGTYSLSEYVPTLFTYLNLSSPEVLTQRVSTLRQIITTIEGIIKGRDVQIVGYCFVLYRFGFIYSALTENLPYDSLNPAQFYKITRRFLSFGFIRKLSKQEKYRNTALRRIYLKRKGRPSWESLLGDRNFEKLTAYAPTEPFRDFLTLVFERLQVRPPEWALRLVSEYAHVLSQPEHDEANKTAAVQELEEVLPEIVDTWLKARAHGWRSAYGHKWKEYVQAVQARYGVGLKELMELVYSYARKELGINV